MLVPHSRPKDQPEQGEQEHQNDFTQNKGKFHD
jgi:hypothetical protein